MDRRVDVAIVGAGTAGLGAMSQVRRHTDNFVLINGGELGTTCARVGCMPSKVAIQIGEDFHRRHYFPRIGISGGDQLAIDIPEAMEHVQDLRDIFVDKVLSNTTDHLGDEFIEGYARFVEPTVLQVGDTTVHAKKVIIATGSRPVVPAAWKAFGDRVLTTDDLFELEDLPARVAMVGLGVIGLELGQALHRLGVEVTGIDQQAFIGGLTDPVVNRVAVDLIGKEFPLWIGEGAEVSEAGDELRVQCGDRSVVVDRIFACMGRVPNIEGLGIENLGVETDARGVPVYDPNTMQVGKLPVFIAGDASGDRAILHEASDEGKIAGYNAAHPLVRPFRRKVPMAITFCDPNFVSVGTPAARGDDDTVVVGDVRFGALGRALIMGRNRGILRMYADKASGRLLGAQMVGARGEHVAHLLAWAMEQEMTVQDMYRMPFYHPTVEEAVQACLRQMLEKVDARETDGIASIRPLV